MAISLSYGICVIIAEILLAFRVGHTCVEEGNVLFFLGSTGAAAGGVGQAVKGHGGWK